MQPEEGTTRSTYVYKNTTPRHRERLAFCLLKNKSVQINSPYRAPGGGRRYGTPILSNRSSSL